MSGALSDPIFQSAKMQQTFGDQAFVAAMVRVEIALAQVQAALGIVPKASAAAILETLGQAEVPHAALSESVAVSGVPVPALVDALRGHLAPEHADWIHFGATSQDIVDTAMALCFKSALGDIGRALAEVLDRLETFSSAHADTLMLARTRGQLATPISFGLRVAQWAQPLIALEAELAEVTRAAVRVQFGGASGSRSVLGDKGALVSAGLASELGLADGPPWHTDRSGVRRLSNWLSRCVSALAKIGRDISIGSRGEISELRVSGSGQSSTMPHKSNPVAAEALQSVGVMAVACEAGLAASAVHAEERDGAMWPVEWVLMPQLFGATGAALGHAQRLIASLEVNEAGMKAGIDAVPAVHSEAAVFALAAKKGRAEASRIVKEAVENDDDLSDVLDKHGGADLKRCIEGAAYLAPAQALAREIFARRIREN